MTRIIAALLLAAGLFFASPITTATAAEPEPCPTEETVQAWKARALAAEARAAQFDADLFFARSAQRTAEDQAAILAARVAFTERMLEDTREDLSIKVRQFYRQFNKITRQRLTIYRLRERLHAARG